MSGTAIAMPTGAHEQPHNEQHWRVSRDPGPRPRPGGPAQCAHRQRGESGLDLRPERQPAPGQEQGQRRHQHLQLRRQRHDAERADEPGDDERPHADLRLRQRGRHYGDHQHCRTHAHEPELRRREPAAQRGVAQRRRGQAEPAHPEPRPGGPPQRACRQRGESELEPWL